MRRAPPVGQHVDARRVAAAVGWVVDGAETGTQLAIGVGAGPGDVDVEVVLFRDDDLRVCTPCSGRSTMSLEQPTVIGALARSASANPQRRNSSMVRADVVLARGRVATTSVRGSTTTHRIP